MNEKLRQWLSIWGPHICVMAAYSATYEILKYFSMTHWMLIAGLRLACLLLVSRKFWPALLVGDLLPVVLQSLMNGHRFGWLWATALTIPHILLYMPIVATLQRRMKLLNADGQINMNVILIAALACSVVSTGISSLALSLVKMPDGTPGPNVDLPVVLQWILGYYLGALVVTPTVLFVRERFARLGPSMWADISRSRLSRDVVGVALPALVVLLLGAIYVAGDALPYFRMAMAVPLVFLTWRHGWHGAAVGGFLASSFQSATVTAVRDPALIQSQVVIAMVISTGLMIGAKLAERHSKAAVMASPHSRTGSITR